MLDAIFWKIAHHARWQDLPVGYPSMYPCRRYYRRLFRSGRLLTLYQALYQDFCAHARLDLAALVERDCFEIHQNKLALSPDVAETWQMRIALLFMQQGYLIYRHLRREKEQQSRRRFRVGSLIIDRLGRIRQVTTLPSPVSPPPPEPEFTFTPLEQFYKSPGFHK